MKIDFSELSDLEIENIGLWPNKFKLMFALLLAIIVMIFGFFFVINDALNTFESEKEKEIQLRNDFQNKYQLAANLGLYRQQLAQIESQFSQLLEMLPSKNEMSGLLDDLTFVATNAGLKMSSLNWESEIERGFYIEFPINMSVSGNYHQIGNMVSGVAKLPRIVSLHDFVISPSGKDGELKMDIQAKTYRFKDENS